MYSQTPINILCATDNGYAPYCGIMLTSLLENNKESSVRLAEYKYYDMAPVMERAVELYLIN